MGGGGGAGAAGQISGRCCQRSPAGGDERPRHRMRRHPDRYGAKPRADAGGNTRRAGQDHGQRSRPKGIRQPPRRVGNRRHQRFHLLKPRNMYDQRVVLRTSLGFKNTGDSGFVGRVRRQSVYGFGRHTDQLATVQTLRGKRNILRCVGQQPGLIAVHERSPAACNFSARSAVISASMISSRSPFIIASIRYRVSPMR